MNILKLKTKILPVKVIKFLKQNNVFNKERLTKK